tara:strand:+ start:333 stop:611 length:279 start_codon:yes stop_codon:yes gene_type:complete
MGFFKWQKTPSKKPPQRTWDPQEIKMIAWCMNRNIKIGISPDWKDDLNRWQVEININGKIHTDPNRYEDYNVYDKLLEYYKYYYKPNTNNNG